MAIGDGLRALQAANYYQLLTIKMLNEKKGIEVAGLKNAIGIARATMTEPEIAWVEKQIAEAYDFKINS